MDGNSVNWIKNNKNYFIIHDIWNNNSNKKLYPYKTFKARLIPLNKVWPSIPNQEQFRPIVVTSAMIKWIEIRFLPRLKVYLKNSLDKF